MTLFSASIHPVLLRPRPETITIEAHATMTITVKFFASLRQQIGHDAVSIAHRPGLTAADAWRQSAGDADLPPATLCAINLEYAALDTRIEDGDEVAFFPPVTGG